MLFLAGLEPSPEKERDGLYGETYAPRLTDTMQMHNSIILLSGVSF